MTDDFSNLTLDEKLSAYIDGELSPDARAAVEHLIAEDQVAASRLEQLRGANLAFTAEAEIVDAAPLSEGLEALMTHLSAEERLIHPVKDTASPRRRTVLAYIREHRALAACAAMLSGLFAMQAGIGTVQMAETDLPTDGIVLVSSDWYDLLETTPSGELRQVSDTLSATPQFSFARQGGEFCRVVDATATERSARLVACREDGAWEIQVASFQARQDSGGPYQTASSGADPAVEAYLDSTMAGAPLGLSAEARAISQGWSPAETSSNSEGDTP